jgi:hypothetical protein
MSKLPSGSHQSSARYLFAGSCARIEDRERACRMQAVKKFGHPFFDGLVGMKL